MNVAFIPVRGGSKSIPLKNIKKINHRPLVYWVIKAAVESKNIDMIYVSTDSPIIRDTVDAFSFPNVKVIDRSPETASDTASTESAMLEFARKYEFTNIILIQATSPLLTAKDIEGGFELFRKDDTTSVFSAVRQKRFIWNINKNGFAVSQNYDPLHRPRRQEFDGYLVENGAYYITSRTDLLNTGCRMSGNIRAYEMTEDAYFEIDEPSDWLIIEQLMKKNNCAASVIQTKLGSIKMFLTDCDGCLTDGGMYYSESGDEFKKFNTKDGMGLANLMKSGVITGIITKENTDMVRRRAEKLRLNELHMGVVDKLAVARDLCNKYNISMDEVAYVGDDLNDIELLQAVGFSASVNNALPDAKNAADYVTSKNGGDGAVREVADLILTNRCR